MTNKYLEKVAALIRSPEAVGHRLGQLGMAGANRLKRTLGVKVNSSGHILNGSKVGAATKFPGRSRMEARADKLTENLPATSDVQRRVHDSFKKTVGNNPNIFN